jgi:hypothetical protein
VYRSYGKKAPEEKMPTIREMNISLDDANFFNDKIQQIVRGPQQDHDLDVIRRYFRAYLHCWKTVLHFVRAVKGKTEKKDWINWCEQWQKKHLDTRTASLMDQLRELRDHDTHSGAIDLKGEIAILTPIVFVEPVSSRHERGELVKCTEEGIEIIRELVNTHAAFP